MFQTKVVKKIKTHILCLMTFFPKIVVCEIMWKTFVELGRPQMSIWHMRIACWIPKATNTHTLRICSTYCFSTATMVARTRLIVTLYVHWLLCCSWLF